MSPGFLSELKRRRVFRAAIAYAVVAFAVLQGADVLAEALRLPGSALTFVAFLAILGFPVVLVLAWVFEVGPEGVKRTEADPAAASSPAPARPRVALALAGVAVVVVLGGAGAYAYVDRTGGAVPEGDEADRSIAVLPFTNMSGIEENEYFSDGITEDILTNLAAISGLRVISRTSVMRYKGMDKSIPDIAGELGVTYLLEGSVRRAGDRVRITAQLIRADTDGHLWAENYDRDLTDIFEIQADVARQIAGALRTELSPDEKRVLAHKPTENLDAYEFYLRGNQYMERAHFREFRENSLRAIEMYRRATELDPKFALAYARLARTETYLFSGLYDTSAERLRSAREALDHALELGPDLAGVRLAHAEYIQWIENDPVRAAIEYGQVLELHPGDPDVLAALGGIAALRNDIPIAMEYAERALSLDPGSMTHALALAGFYTDLGDPVRAERMIERAQAQAPRELAPYIARARLAIVSRGDTAAARAALAEAAERVGGETVAFELVVQGHFRLLPLLPDEARLLDRLRRESFGSDSLGLAWHHAARVSVRARAGDREGAVAGARAAREMIAALLDVPGLGPAMEASIRSSLGQVLAVVREKEAAFRHLRTAAASVDRPGFENPFLAARLSTAEAHARLGQADAAAEILEELLARDYPPITRNEIRVLPVWAPVRQHPRIQQVLRGEL